MTVQRVLNVVGARPNLIKIAPIVQALSEAGLEQTLVHTGQHYDHKMSRIFFEELGLPEPDVYLGVGSGSHATQTAHIMTGLEQTILKLSPDLVLVVGDVNSTLAGALVASKLQIAIAHVEAGLRSYNRSMPEEINRIVTDALSDYLFTTERDAASNLLQEGIHPGKIHFVGNVMVDSLLAHRQKALELDVLSEFGLAPRGYTLLTLHRPNNVDSSEALRSLLEAMVRVSTRTPIIFPVHPRTQARIKDFGLGHLLESARVVICDPLGYLPFINLMSNASFVMTDSGGVQEETTVLGVPCLTLRPETERPITVTEGTNTIVGDDRALLADEIEKILIGGGKQGRIPELWDGKAAQRIVGVLCA